jgi:phage tail tape-measure protein
MVGKEKPMRRITAVAAVLSVTLLAACGSRQPERAEGGAAAGAATGATVGLVGGPVGVVAGGAIGAVAGGATGAATKSRDVNLGTPPWHDNTKTGQTAAEHMQN